MKKEIGCDEVMDYLDNEPVKPLNEYPTPIGNHLNLCHPCFQYFQATFFLAQKSKKIERVSLWAQFLEALDRRLTKFRIPFPAMVGVFSFLVVIGITIGMLNTDSQTSLTTSVSSQADSEETALYIDDYDYENRNMTYYYTIYSQY